MDIMQKHCITGFFLRLAILTLATQILFAQTAEQLPAEQPPTEQPLTEHECDAVFNPVKRFCHDGKVYDKCDGMTYNPSTHICADEIAIRAICNGEQYNPLIQKCEINIPETVEEEIHTEVIATEPEPAKQAEIEKLEEKPEEPRKSVLSLGFRAGFNFSRMYEEDSRHGSSGSLNSKAGIQAGLLLDIAAIDWLHFQPGIAYIQKGAKYKGSSLTLHYIELPIQASFKLSVFQLNAGPYFALLPAASKGDYERYDFGLSYGGGFGIGSFSINVFHDYDLANVSKRSNYETYIRSLGFNLGYNL